MATEGVQVIMVSLALQGHINPMLKFAKVLVSKGVHVTIATNDVARKRMLDSKISTKFTEGSNGSRLNLEFFSDGLSHEFDRDKDTGTFIASLKKNGPKNLYDLIANLKAEGNQFVCLISSPFIPWVAGVATEHLIPCSVLWIQSSTVFSIYYHCIKHPDLFPHLENPNADVEVPGLPILKVGDLPTFMLPISPPHFRQWVAEFISVLDKVEWVLGNSFHELEEEIVNTIASVKPFYPIGPLVSPFLLGKEETIVGSVDMWSAEDSCIEWLDRQSAGSVIYISFGSIILSSTKQIESIATALKNVKRPFIWVVKSFEARKGEFPPEFLEETKELGLIVSWCSQEKVLMHQALACFVTHCGWNSTLETVVAGVPVIAYPEWTDQPTDAKLLVDVFKIGVRMRNCEDGETPSVEEVERCIREIIEGQRAEEMKTRATKLKAVAKKALEDGGSSNQNIDKFISEISGRSSNNNF